MTAIPGYSCLIRRSGTSTTVTGEALSQVSGSTYRVTAAAKRCIDPNVAYVFYDDATPIANSGITSIDFAHGVVVFASTPSGAVTMDGAYLPLTTSAEVVTDVRSFSLNESTDLLDTTVMTGTTSLHAAIRKRMPGLKDVEMSLESIAAPSAHSALYAVYASGDYVVTEVYFGDPAVPAFRGFCKLENIERSGSVEDMIVSNLTFKIAAFNDPTGGKVVSYSYRALS